MECDIDCNEPPLLYLYLYQKLVDSFGYYNREISLNSILEIFRRTIYKVPKKYEARVLSEMEKFAFLKQVNSQKYLFIGKNAQKRLKRLNEFFLW